MKFFHSADWQIGARFSQFGSQAPRLREARVATLRRALAEAERCGAEAFLVAGDLFEDPQIEPALIAAVYDGFAEHPGVPIFICPGNHDPYTGPASIWSRRPFSEPPPHVKIFRHAEACPLGEAWIIANPLTQKRSSVDPSAEVARLARELPPEAIKIGLTHGSPAIGSLHQPDDFPIDLNAAARGGLDYLALGHWHSAQVFAGGRMCMPGAPEPTGFGEAGGGCVQQVEIRRAGELPRITPVRVAAWRWEERHCDLTGDPRAVIEEFARALGDEAPRCVARVILRGSAPAREAEGFREWLRERLSGVGLLDLRDETVSEVAAAELAGLCSEHPILEFVLADLQALAAHLATDAHPELLHSGFSPTVFAEVCERIGFPLAEATPEFVANARRLLLAELREAAAC